MSFKQSSPTRSNQYNSPKNRDYSQASPEGFTNDKDHNLTKSPCSPGTKVLRYVLSEYYGQKGESNQLVDNIEVRANILTPISDTGICY